MAIGRPYWIWPVRTVDVGGSGACDRWMHVRHRSKQIHVPCRGDCSPRVIGSRRGYSADGETVFQMVGDNGSRCVSGRVPHHGPNRFGSTSRNSLEREAGALCNLLMPIAVSGDRHNENCLSLTEPRVPALTIWRFLAYADFLRDGGRGVDPALTAMLNGFLILAAIFATALPLIIKMQRRHSSEHELETWPGQNETPSIAQRTALRVGEEVDVPHDQSKEATSARCSDYKWLPCRLPPPTTPLPQPPQQSPVTPPPPLQSSWPSSSTLQGFGDGRDAYIITVPPCVWSSIGPK